jgi:hypothetical protein
VTTPASKGDLNALHALLAETMAKRLRSGEVTAADLNVARQFLKDNNIEALAVPGSPIAGLKSAVDNLPFPQEGMSH